MSARSVESGSFKIIYQKPMEISPSDFTSRVQTAAQPALNRTPSAADLVARQLQRYEDQQLRIIGIRAKYAAQRAPLEVKRRELEAQLVAIDLDDEKFDEKTNPIHEALDKVTSELGVLFRAEVDEIQNLLPTN